MKRISTLKLNLMRATLTLALIVTCAAAWAQNPNLADYTFTTGQNANKWITLSDNATQMIGSGEDDTNSSKTSIGFDFPFGDGTYSLFWTNSNGILSFNSNPTSNYACQFTQFGYQNNQPKICGISADMSTGNNGYVKYELTGTAPNRVLVCEFFLRGNSYENDPANIKWQVQLHEANAKVVMVYGDALDTTLNDNQIGLSQSKSDIWTINPSTHEAIHSTGFVGAKYSSWPGAYRYYQFNPPVPFTDNGDGTYTINTAAGWGLFCDAIEGGESFNGKTVKLGADITVSRMAGSGTGGDLTTSDHPFCGTFDGQGNTLTFNYGSSGSPANENNLAPFRYVNNATIQYLHVAGDIYTQHVHCGGIVGQAYGTTNITDCRSSVNIVSSINGDGTHGGIMSCSWTGSTTNITGCLFDGSIQSADGYTTNQCGGFVGWKNAIINVTNSLLTATFTNIATGTGDYPSATFVRNGDPSTITNCYYVTALGTEQGKQRHSITEGENVTVAHSGTATAYATSGITAYKNGDTQLPGLKYGDVLYAGDGDNVSLTLGNTPPPGSIFMGYTVSPEGTTLNGNNPYTLTMPDADVIIGAVIKGPVTYLDENGEEQTANALPLLGGGATTLAAGWYVVNSDISYTGTVTLGGDVHLILADGKTMTVTPANAHGIDVDGHALTIYGQTNGTGTLTATASGWNPAICAASSILNIHGGTINAIYNGTEKNDAINIDCWESFGAMTITGGKVTADGGDYGAGISIGGCHAQILGGQVTARGFHGIYIWDNDPLPATLTLGCSKVTDFISIRDIYNYAGQEFEADVQIADGQTLYDGTNIYSGTLTNDQISVLAGKTLRLVTAYKSIAAHGEGNGGWYLIASPVGNVNATEVPNLITTASEYDLYYFDQTGGDNGKEWKNYKAHHSDATNPFNALVSGQGYLYANSANVNLIFTGTPYDGDGVVNLERSDRNDIDENMRGWNLVGNPFTVNASVDRPFYIMNEGGSEIIAATQVERNYVEPMEGIFVYAETEGLSVTFTPNEPSKGHSQKPEPDQVVLNLSRPSTGSGTGSTAVIDRAIVRMGEGQTLPKFQIRENSTKLYIPQNGKDYAIISVGNMGEVPVNFRANENGTYTLTISETFNSQLSTLNYLHLIDNMTGADVDLLQTPEYTFTAKTSDYESRFRLVFSVCGDADGDDDAPFAYIDATGNIVITADARGASLQVIDVNGRVLVSVGGHTRCVPTAGMTPGVYVLRLIDGEDVRVQKIVVYF